MKLAFLGDIAFFGKFSMANKDIYKYFSEVSEYLKSFDHVIGNLETPFYNGKQTYGYKSAYIKSREENVELLKYLNIDIVNLANNHIYDYGLAGLRRMISLLEKNGIDYFGINNIHHKITEKNQNNKIAFSGYCCYSTNGVGYLTSDRKHGVNVLNAFNIEKNMIRNHEEGYFNILSIHAGEEHIHYPNYDHVLMARKLASKVPYVYYGHHPHVMQGIEKTGNSLIAYSLGNFCFDDVFIDMSNEPLIRQSVENRKSFILSLDIIKNNVSKYEIIPIFSGDAVFEVGKSSSIKEDVNKYSDYLHYEKKRYIRERDVCRNDYITSRKRARNFEWYLKRMKLCTLIMFIKAIKNRNEYKKMINRYFCENE